jgi:hypothetical protein
VSCDHALLALLDALELQRSLLRDGARDADAGPHRAAFEAVERVAVTEANRLTGDAAVPAVVRARARAFVAGATRTTSRPAIPAPVPPRAPTPMPSMPAALPRSATPGAPAPLFGVPRIPSGARAGAVPSQASPAGAFPGLAALLSPTHEPAPKLSSDGRLRIEDHLGALTAGWTCPHCGIDVAMTLHVSRVRGGRSAVVVDVVCAHCNQRSPLPAPLQRSFDRLYGPLIGQSGTSFSPELHGLRWDGT